MRAGHSVLGDLVFSTSSLCCTLIIAEKDRVPHRLTDATVDNHTMIQCNHYYGGSACSSKTSIVTKA